MAKVCKRCAATLPIESFHRWALSKDGRSDWCKPCRAAHAVAISDVRKQYQHEYYAAHRVQSREQSRRWSALNPGRKLELQRRWKERNPENVKVQAVAHAARRRAAKLGTASPLTATEWQSRFAEFNGRCAYCLQPLTAIHMEHMTPLSRGGQHDLDNVVPACPACNLRKHKSTLLEFISREHGRRMQPIQQAA